jgi:hypothetical protein
MGSKGIEGEEPFKPELPSTMLSIQVQEFGEPSVMKCLPAKVPVPGKGEVLVRLCGEMQMQILSFVYNGGKLPA